MIGRHGSCWTKRHRRGVFFNTKRQMIYILKHKILERVESRPRQHHLHAIICSWQGFVSEWSDIWFNAPLLPSWNIYLFIVIIFLYCCAR
jgi:hypothetical protein